MPNRSVLQPQTILLIHCLKAAPAELKPDNILIAGGESITNITATFVTSASTPPPQHDRDTAELTSHRCRTRPTSC